MPEIVIPYQPRPQMGPYHDRQQRLACIVAHRRFGKTTACLNDLQRGALSCRRPQPRFAYLTPLLRQGKDVAWDKLKRIAAPLLEYGATFNEAELRVDYPNGGRVRIYGADNPDSLRGIYLDGAVLDEYAQMDPVMWDEVIRLALADRQGWATFIGTPKGRDAFYKTWTKALSRPTEWYSLILRASDTKILPESELKAIFEEIGPAAYARELECSFDVPSEMQLISGLLVNAAVNRSGAQARGPKVIGVDVARSEDGDHSVVLYRNGDTVPDDGIFRMRGRDTMQLVGMVSEAIEKYKPDATFIDSIGVGGPVADRLRQLGFAITDLNVANPALDPTRYHNLRIEMWVKMKAWLERGRIPHDERLESDLTAPLYKYDGSNRMQLQSKSEMKDSPDTGDALAMTFAMPVATFDVRQIRWAEQPAYDPFA